MATEFNWLDLVVEQDDEFYEREIVYEFSNGREFQNSDKDDTGVYGYD